MIDHAVSELRFSDFCLKYDDLSLKDNLEITPLKLRPFTIFWFLEP